MVKTRSSLQLIFEVPLEKQELVMRALGVPMPNVSNPVAICRLVEVPQQAEPAQIEHANDDADDDADEQKPPRPLSQIAGMLCGVGSFQQFILENSKDWDHRPTSDEAAVWLRTVCGVESRAELNTNQIAAQRFVKIRADYNAWLTDPVPA